MHDEDLQIRREQHFLFEGMCPNGCAPLVWDDAYQNRCPKCRYRGWSRKPYDGSMSSNDPKPPTEEDKS